MAVKTYPKTSQEKLSDHFNVSEFACPCTTCTETLLDSDLVSKLEGVRLLLQAPIRINSGYRCANYQAELRLRGYETAVGLSQHQLGRAADIMASEGDVSGGVLEALSRQAGFRAVGVGNVWVHVDLRDDRDRRWTYTR